MNRTHLTNLLPKSYARITSLRGVATLNDLHERAHAELRSLRARLALRRSGESRETIGSLNIKISYAQAALDLADALLPPTR